MPRTGKTQSDAAHVGRTIQAKELRVQTTAHGRYQKLGEASKSPRVRNTPDIPKNKAVETLNHLLWSTSVIAQYSPRSDFETHSVYTTNELRMDGC